MLASIFFSPRFIKAQRRTWPIFSFFTSHLVSNAYNYTPECVGLRNLNVSLIPKQMGRKLLNSTNKGNKFILAIANNAFTVVY